MRGLVTGSLGQLGRAFLELGPGRGWELQGIDIDRVDIREAEATRAAVTEARPEWVFHCAARTDVDGCEGDEEEAWRVNAQGARNVQAAARDVGASFLLVSTDFVFPGDRDRPYGEEDPVAPLCAYGRTKEAGERLCLEAWPQGTWIARTQWLYGPGGRHFVGAVIDKARREGKLRVVDDQVGCPTMTLDLARALLDLAGSEAPPGIYHASNQGEASWFELAGAALRLAGIEGVGIEPIAAADLDLPARRPAYSVLRKNRLEEAIGRPLRHWRTALADYLAASRGKG